MRHDLGLLRVFLKDGQKKPRQSHGDTQRIGGTRKARSETGSGGKTQGLQLRKQLEATISTAD
jgi:hypothetical protein